MAQHSGGIRRPRKSYLISLLPISHFHSPFSFIHTSIPFFPFFSFLALSPSCSFPFSTSSPSCFVSPFFSPSYFSHPLAILPTRTLSVSLRSTLDFAHAFATLSLSFLLIHTRIHAASAQPSMHSLARSFSRHFNIFFFCSSSIRFCLFVGVNGFTYLQAFFSWSCINLPLEATYLPPITYISFFSFFSLSLFSFFLFFLFHLNIGKLDIVSQSLSIFFVLFASNLVVESNILKPVCVSRNTSRLRVSLYVYLLLVCLSVSVSVYACFVCVCVCERCDEQHLGRPACLRAEPPNSLELFAYRRKKREKVRR